MYRMLVVEKSMLNGESHLVLFRSSSFFDIANENEKLESPKINAKQKNKINSKLSRNYKGLQKHDPNLTSTKMREDVTKQKKNSEQLTGYPSSERDMLFSFLSNKDGQR